MKNTILLFTFFLFSVTAAFSQNWNQIQKIGTLDQEAADNLGISMAISDSFMFAGAWWEDGDFGGMASVNSAGAAYVFKLQPNGNWKEIQKLVSPNRETLGYFGFSVGIKGDQAIVGAFNEDEGSVGNAGHVYVYERQQGDDWTLKASLKASDGHNEDEMGKAIAITDGYVIAGAHNHDFTENGQDSMRDAGAVYIFRREGNGSWMQVKKLVAPDRAAKDNFGKYVDIDNLGLVIGAHDADPGMNMIEAGSAYGWHYNDTMMVNIFNNVRATDLQKITISDPQFFGAFGWDVAISGKWAVIGKSGESIGPGGVPGKGNGAAYFFKFENGSWVEKQKVYPSDSENSGDFGRSIDIDGNACVIGAGTARSDANQGNIVNGAGAAHVFELKNGKWEEVEKLAGTGRASNDLFGEAVAISANHIAVGAWLADSLPGGELIDGGAIYTYRRDAALALETRAEWNGISLANNPAVNGVLQIRSKEPTPAEINIQVFSLMGQSVFSEKILIENDWSTDLSHLSSGIYWVQVHRQGFAPKSWKWIR